MKFVEQAKTGKVLGNAVKALPVPFSAMMTVQNVSGDNVAAAQAMMDIVEKYVTMEDGTPISCAEISADAVVKLFEFATKTNGGSVGDFT